MNEQKANQILDGLLGRNIGSLFIEKEIGRGGMGAVFAGKQITLDRPVAVKVLLPDVVDDELAILRFRREALAIARLKSPYIVQVFDTGETEDGIFYIVMEYLEGDTLTEQIRKHTRFPVPYALDLVYQTVQGLHTAHQSGLIHRDIKPSNLMLSTNHQIGITDFGLARSYEPSGSSVAQVTQEQVMVGTPSYISPEQIKGEQLDGRTDIYSLGIVFFHMMVGHPPFESDDVMKILVKQFRDPLPDPRLEVPDIPDDVLQVLNNMTAKKPEDRYPDTRTLAKDLAILIQKYPHKPTSPLTTAHRSSITSHTMSHSLSSSIFDSNPSTSGQNLSFVPPSEAVSVEVMKQLQVELAKQIGPIAKVTLKKEVKAMGYSRRQFPSANMEQLVQRLSQHINDTQRSEFLAVATKLYVTS